MDFDLITSKNQFSEELSSATSSPNSSYFHSVLLDILKRFSQMSEVVGCSELEPRLGFISALSIINEVSYCSMSQGNSRQT